MSVNSPSSHREVRLRPSGAYRKDYHPLYVKYLESTGDLKNLLEKRACVEEDLVRLKDQDKNRRQFGLTLSKYNQNLLNNIPKEIRLLDVEIHKNRFEQLRKQCLQQGIIDEDDNYIYGDGEDSDDSDNSVPPPPPPLPLPPLTAPKPPVPTLPPQINITANGPSSLPTTAHSIVSNLGTRLNNKSYQDRINPWLSKLTRSPTEVAPPPAMDANPDVASL